MTSWRSTARSEFFDQVIIRKALDTSDEFLDKIDAY